MNIRRVYSDPNAPLPSDDCSDCGQFMLSIMIGRDGKRRCVACHQTNSKVG